MARDRRLLTPRDVERRWGLPTALIVAAIRERKIPARYHGNHVRGDYRLREGDLRAWLGQNGATA